MEKNIKAYSIEEISSLVVASKLPSFRSQQLLSWLYLKGASSYEEMTDLPKVMREQFSELYPLSKPSVVDKQCSVDGTVKYLLKSDDDALFETVALPSEDGRLTACVSSQSGCAMKCEFCATGKAGLKRNLVPGEFVDQILSIQNDLEERVTNVVVMGQGEPFANYYNTLAALRIMNHPKLLNIGARHLTISTCGIIKGIQKLSNETEQFTLAISLHSARQETRDRIMPGVSNQPLGRLKEALTSYTNATGRRFSFEYALMKGFNDSSDDLDALVDYCRGMLCHVNLIPLNDINDSPFKPVGISTLRNWQRCLESSGIAASIRKSRGTDISAACGQLANSFK